MTTVKAASSPIDASILVGASVLVVDDDDQMRQALSRWLVSAGACVRDAANGDGAIAIASREPIDLLLTDIEMPGRDGPAVAHAVVSLRPRAAVVFMSGRPRAVHLATGRLAPADRMIEKPFTSHGLVDALVTALATVGAV